MQSRILIVVAALGTTLLISCAAPLPGSSTRNGASSLAPLADPASEDVSPGDSARQAMPASWNGAFYGAIFGETSVPSDTPSPFSMRFVTQEESKTPEEKPKTPEEQEPGARPSQRELPNDPGDRDHNLGKTHSLKQIQAALNNPLSDIWSLQFQNTLQFNRGEPSRGSYRGEYEMLFQPALPVPLTKDWTLINRPIISVLSTPTYDGDWDRASGLGAFTYEGWITSSKPSKFTTGWGGVFSMPVGTRDEMSSRKYSLGPSAVAVWKHGDWVLGGLGQYLWSVSGTDKRQNVSNLSLQYFVTWLGLPDNWQLNMSPTITYNKKADGPDAWHVPIGIGLGKMVKLGKVPVKLQFEWDAYVIRSDSFGPRHAFFLKITPVIPALIKKPLL